MAEHSFATTSEMIRAMPRYSRAGFGSLALAGIVGVLCFVGVVGLAQWPASLNVLLSAVAVWCIAVGWYCLRRADLLASTAIRRLNRTAMKRLERMGAAEVAGAGVESSYMRARLEEEQARIDRHGGVMSLLYVSVQGVDEVTQRYGEEARGDVMDDVVELLTRGLRTYDAVGRLGETAYVTVLPSANRRGAQKVAERSRRAVENYRRDLGDGRTVDSIRVAIGLAAYPVNGENMDNVLTAAQNALQKALAREGNAVEVADEFVRTSPTGEVVASQAPLTDGEQ